MTKPDTTKPPTAATRDIGRTLYRQRLIRGMKQSHLAELAGVTQATVSRWERGHHHPTQQQRAVLARILRAQLHSHNDAALKRLVETSSLAVHLVCDLSHNLLAVSPTRLAEWRCSESEILGDTLWPFATEGIQRGENKLRECGWFEPDARPVLLWTGRNTEQIIRIEPGLLLWERIQLSDGNVARLVTTASRDYLEAQAPHAIRLATFQPATVTRLPQRE